MLDLPLDQPLVAMIGGSMGMGLLDRAAEEIAATGIAVPVVLCGRNKRLYRRLRDKSSVIARDWISDIPMLLTAVDGVVQNAGGFACLEALAAGKPTVTYRCISGHGETNAAALDRAGIVPWIRNAGRPRPPAPGGPGHSAAQPVGRRRRRPLRRRRRDPGPAGRLTVGLSVRSATAAMAGAVAANSAAKPCRQLG